MNIDDIKNKININKDNWKHTLTTNCYAYALGIDINENRIITDAYQPGVMSGDYTVRDNDVFTYRELLKCFYHDMKTIGIILREVKPSEKVGENEWKIALFTSVYGYYRNVEMFSDYHFLREKNGIWYHKPGYHSKPTNKDSYGKIIDNLDECYLYGREYKKTYSLKLKKN